MTLKRSLDEIVEDLRRLEGTDQDCSPLFREMLNNYGALYLDRLQGVFKITQPVEVSSDFRRL